MRFLKCNAKDKTEADKRQPETALRISKTDGGQKYFMLCVRVATLDE
ncbi:hypothetical protein [Dyadobacter sp.]